MPRRKKLLIVDDNHFFSACLKKLVNAEPDLVVCGDADSSASLEARLKACDPDVIVIDMGLGREDGIAIARGLRRRNVQVPLVFISSLSVPTAAGLRQIGRCAFWKKGESDEGLLKIVRQMIRHYVPADLGPREAQVSGQAAPCVGGQ